MLSRLLIRNFRRLERLVIDLDPRVTVLWGDSDAGKSTAVRALRWLVFNQPLGDSVLRWGEDSALVKLTADDDTVTRSKGKGKNVYKVGKAVYKSFGAGVPQPVADLLKISPASFQLQLDPPYWFGLTPGEVSRELNDLAGLTDADDALHRANTLLRRAEAEEEVTRKRLEDARGRVESLAWVEEFDADLRRLEAREAEVARIRSRIALAETCQESWGDALFAKENAAEAILDAKAVLSAFERVEALQARIWEVEGVAAEMTRCKAVLHRGRPDTTELDEAEARVESLRSRIASLEDVAADLVRFRGQMRTAEKEREAAEAELAEILRGACPLCGRE